MIDFPNVPDITGILINSEIHICKEIPWDSEYKNVRLFSNKTKAWEYVTAKEIFSYTCTSVKNNRIKVACDYSVTLANANYLCFKNNDNMFFAFIMDMSYISQTVVEFTFKIDIFQTYFYECNILPCFVEREHINRSEDIIGNNTLPEPVSTGEYLLSEKQSVTYNDMRVLVYTTATESVTGVKMYYGGMNNVFSGVNIFSGTNITIVPQLAMIILAGKESEIIQIQMCPTFCGDLTDPENPVVANTVNVSVNVTNLFNGYIPKNKKLYTNPYCFVQVDNNSGGTMELHFELSNNKNTLTVRTTGCLCTTPTIISYPIDYNNEVEFRNESIVHSNFPTCVTSGNAYAQWLNANNITLATAAQAQAMRTEFSSLANITQGAIGGISNAISGNITGVLNNATSTLLNQTGINLNQGIYEMTMDAQYKQAAQKPNGSVGSIGGSSINTAINRNQTDVISYSIRDYKSVDDFFSVYGYTTKKIKKPNLNNRKLWNYIQTTNCVLQGSCGNNYLTALQSIFNKGVFVWHTNEIGNFDVNNNG